MFEKMAVLPQTRAATLFLLRRAILVILFKIRSNSILDIAMHVKIRSIGDTSDLFYATIIELSSLDQVRNGMAKLDAVSFFWKLNIERNRS